VIALQSQKLLGEELEGETNATNRTTTTTTNSTAPTTTVRPQLSESDRMKELIKKAIKSVAKYNSQMQKEIADERRKYFDLQTMVHIVAFNNNINYCDLTFTFYRGYIARLIL
jgi:hypothetical protein